MAEKLGGALRLGALPARECKVYACSVITPMFGGGAKAGEVGREFPVRAPSIRGQLRFWWRLLHGVRGLRGNALKEKECALWGGVFAASSDGDKAALQHTSRVGVFIKEGAGQSVVLKPVKDAQYALFPFRDKSGVLPEFNFDLGVVCEPQLCSELKEQLERSLRAWANFGGVGARTRRGCGAVFCPELAFENEEEARALAVSCGLRVWTKECDSKQSIVAWKEAVGCLREFRQGKDVGRNGTRGRSRWPEADTIRKLTGQRDPRHEAVYPPDHPYGFPRAVFGMPIGFRFKTSGDPKSCQQLLPVGAQRMSSPVILRPLRLKDGRVLSMAVFLPEPDLSCGLRLSGNKLGGRLNKLDKECSDYQGAKFANYKGSPMENRSSTGNALEAFRAYLREKGFKEVTGK
ncbi:type III-B CRISPR module RAMP protein Cmr1 [Pyramidobacter sp. YE332]|uniref:type III-B CRISPR module RAMP protein Cmr1 n=1 Tax=unclassified Pyramidobacter TaxID=2632171 RepID=UPI00098EA36E|nr:MULTISPECIES: type III-B CRISPR module RAMP protein Cmr1 [unclassified Pyramidobacter]OON86623.1 type III-B CRISPR module RAMP protein Cmr1 [Pyramidobacter sp. C12-8]WOL41332.1 type III-B CRISPR module RAMP protein Cmr1 [Pyramidobacter sp. YE332]